MQKRRLAVARTADIVPGRATVAAIGDTGETCALLLHNGRYLAVGGLCPHQNASLDDAPVQNGEIVCPRHGYCFDAQTGACRTIGGYGLPVYETQVIDAIIYVWMWDFHGN